jgi:DNA-binding FadR family transcriptional regulator
VEHQRPGTVTTVRTGAPDDEMVPGLPKRASLLAYQLEREIIDAGWSVGSLIGTEPELLDRLGVGRGVLREAARLLEDHQVAKMRRGRGGGLIVLQPDVRAVMEALPIYLESLGVSSDDVFEARQVLDLFAVQLAADRIDEQHSARLRELLEEEGQADERHILSGSHRQIHAAIAEASGNPAIAVFAEALSLLGGDQDVMRGKLTGAASKRPATGVHRAHQAIVEAIISGDGLLASHRMLKHLTALHQELIHRPARRPQPVDDPASSGQTGRTLARCIRRDIAQLGWPVGHNLGSETELLERYGTGRAGLREAVRLLEHHAAVEMRRGPGGGLIVRAPDGEAILRAATLHLEYRGIRPVDLFEVREALEMATLQLAIERMDDDGQKRLGQAIERGGDLLAADFAQASHDIHVVIAELSGNRTLQLFIAILTDITAARMPQPTGKRRRTASAARVQIAHAHNSIAEAILAGDTPLARRRMRLHLRALECSIA